MTFVGTEPVAAHRWGNAGESGAVGASPAAPKIAFILSQFPETHETFILREFTALAERGLDFVIFSLKSCRDKIVQSEARRFVPRTYYPFGRSAGGARARALAAAVRQRRALPWAKSPVQCAYVAWAAGRFARLGRDLGITHVHAHWATAPTSAAAVIAGALGVPYSFTAHAWDIYAGDGKLSPKAREARFIVTCTGANAEYIKSALPPEDSAKVILNYHGIPARRARAGAEKSRNGVFRIAAVGRLVPTKGFEYLIEALRRADFPFELTIIGDGPLRQGLQAAAREGGIAARVRFAGAVANEEVFSTLAASDCFVMPSVIAGDGDRDGIPNVLLEAMSVGLPAVASRISGIPEAVEDGRSGILVPERDSPAILDALRRLNADPARSAAMGRAAREIMSRKFLAEANAGSLYDIFDKFAGRVAK